MSSDAFRALVSDDENDQSSTDDVFAALHFVAARRLARAKLTVVDATNVQPEARKPLVALAREYDVLPVAIVLDLPERVCHDRNRSRPDRDLVRTSFGTSVASSIGRCAASDAKASVTYMCSSRGTNRALV